MNQHKCDYCDKIYKHSFLVTRHQKVCVSKIEKDTLKCTYCKKKFSSYSYIKKHHHVCKWNPSNSLKNESDSDSVSDSGQEEKDLVVEDVVVMKNPAHETSSIVINNNSNKSILLADVSGFCEKHVRLGGNINVTINNNNFANAKIKISNRKYIETYYKNAPKLEMRSLIYPENDVLIDDIMKCEDDKKIVKYFGKIIIKHRRFEDPELQSMWNLDVARKNYLIKKDTKWHKDVSAKQLIELIEDALLDKVDELANHIGELKRETISKMSSGDRNEARENHLKRQKKIHDLRNSIQKNNFCKNIAKYICGEFETRRHALVLV